jgi:hypothetical protein
VPGVRPAERMDKPQRQAPATCLPGGPPDRRERRLGPINPDNNRPPGLLCLHRIPPRGCAGSDACTSRARAAVAAGLKRRRRSALLAPPSVPAKAGGDPIATARTKVPLRGTNAPASRATKPRHSG